MRAAGAIFLLSLILLSWLGSCRLCFEVTYELRLFHRMNLREARIARSFSEQFQQHFLVREVDESALRGQFYSGDFVFAEASGADTVRYLLIDENRVNALERTLQPLETGREEAPDVVVLKAFFKDFLFDRPDLHLQQPAHRAAAAACQSFPYQAPDRFVAGPPPDLFS